MKKKLIKILLDSRRTGGTTPAVAPTLDSITIENAAPTDVVMVFSEAVTGTNLGFTIAGSTSSVFASISGSGTTTITGVLAVDAAFGETITLSYSESTGDLTGGSSNPVEDITTQAVTNNVADLYGSELITEGDFSNSGAAWTLPAGWAVVSEEATFTASSNTANQLNVSVPSADHKVDFTIAGVVAGIGLRIRLGNGTYSSFYGNGTHSITITSGGGTTFDMQADAASTGTIDDISVKEKL